MSRSDARVCGFLLTFEYLFSKEFNENLLFEEQIVSEEEKKFSLQIFESVQKNFDEIDLKIESFLKNNLKIKDLCAIDHAILMTALAQVDFLNEPKGLVINEAVRIAKKYSTDKSSSFVNGVLSSIYGKSDGKSEGENAENAEC
ncbi:MAG: transcription antitermination protein NusB [Clostridia bacterium]|nr:transcription antitermination protein NusB [Clostridia bacterium]